MEYLGRSARVPHGDGTWSKFMPIREAEKYEHHLNVQRFLKMLRAGKQVIGLSDDIPAMYAAQDLYKKERESLESLTKTTNQRGHGNRPPLQPQGVRTMIATTILAKVDNERLQRGVEGLASGAYAITVTRFTEDEVSAFVANGDGKSYSVTLTAIRSFCGCSDAMFRGKTCKHAVALSLYVIRTPETKWATEMPAPDLSLAKTRNHADSAPF